jgi:hypothetical protein
MASSASGYEPTNAKLPGPPATSPTSSPAPTKPPTEQDAELRRAEAQAAADEAEQNGLREAAEVTEALADTLTARASELAELDDARSRWLAHTAETRAAAERAKAELAARHADDVAPEPEVTAQEWLATHRQAVADEEAHPRRDRCRRDGQAQGHRRRSMRQERGSS